MLIFFLSGYLPLACSKSFIIDDTGEVSGGVWYSPLIHVTPLPTEIARPFAGELSTV